MAVEDHRLYSKWRAALEMVLATKKSRDIPFHGSSEYQAAELQHRAAFYDAVAENSDADQAFRSACFPTLL
jgi:hypothetical protein